MMHSARLMHSPRLQRVQRLLSDGLPHSTRDIVIGANVCAVNSAIAELRDNGIPIRCWRVGERWFYQLGDDDEQR